MVGKLVLISALAVLIGAMGRGHLRLTLIAAGDGWECVWPRECAALAIAALPPPSPNQGYAERAMDALPAQPDGYAPAY